MTIIRLISIPLAAVMPIGALIILIGSDLSALNVSWMTLVIARYEWGHFIPNELRELKRNRNIRTDAWRAR